MKSFFGLFQKHVPVQAMPAGSPGAVGAKPQYIVAMVTNIKDSLGWMMTSDASEQLKLINKYYSIVASRVMMRGGMLDKFAGDRTFTIFLSPSRGLHQEITCAMEVLRALEQLDSGCPGFTVSLVAGEALVGMWGGELRVSYSAHGPTVSRAFRLSGMAKPGSVIVDLPTFDRFDDTLGYSKRARKVETSSGAAMEIPSS